jgi:hypothetical protein
LLFDPLDQASLQFSIVHRKNRLLAVQVPLNVGAFSSFENCSLRGEPP